MKTEDGPRTWICKTSKSGNSIAVAYESLIKNRVAGFSLVDIDPSEYPDLKTLKDNIVVQNKKENILTGGPSARKLGRSTHKPNQATGFSSNATMQTRSPKGRIVLS